ncbi:MAG: N5-carboxyaminoimidazole ribonucleotide mutase [Bacteroidia bacterium]|nr:MAG: N5-carboxyaminoimidazole ribonucleotide mutase [Bacteroidia bacterium]
MTKNPLVGIVMGSDSDLSVMQEAADILKEFDIPFELDIVSAHRTPDKMREYAITAHQRGLKVIIAGAGGAAHLPGMIASYTILPVIGVPILSRNSIDGWDSLLSIVQMPAGVPVATVAVNGSKNAGLLAVEILASNDPVLQNLLLQYKEQLKQSVLEKSQKTKTVYRGS